MIDGQYEIAGYRFGTNTQLMVSSVTFEGYEVNASDFNRENTDEMVFGRDTLKPGLVTFELGALDNYMLSTLGDAPGFKRSREVLEDFTKAWRGDSIRGLWNEYLPMYYKRHGQERAIFGRPRKINALPHANKRGNIPITCQYQTADTFTYSRKEWYNDGPPVAFGTRNIAINRDLLDGPAPAWFSLIIEGPITNPKIQVGPDMTIELQASITAGQFIEISSYPWRRRVINSSSQTLSAFLIGDSPYMDEMKIPPKVLTTVGLSGSGTSGATKLSVLWREAYYAV